MAIQMGLGKLGSSTITFGHKKWYWLIDIKGKYNLKHTFNDRIKIKNRPQLDIEETEINFLASKTWVPNKEPKLEECCGTIFVPLTLGKKIDLMELAAAQQPIECKIDLFDGTGFHLESWIFHDAIMHQAKEDCTDYASGPETAFFIKWIYKSVEYKSLTPTINI